MQASDKLTKYEVDNIVTDNTCEATLGSDEAKPLTFLEISGAYCLSHSQCTAGQGRCVLLQWYYWFLISYYWSGLKDQVGSR